MYKFSVCPSSPSDFVQTQFWLEIVKKKASETRGKPLFARNFWKTKQKNSEQNKILKKIKICPFQSLFTKLI